MARLYRQHGASLSRPDFLIILLPWGASILRPISPSARYWAQSYAAQRGIGDSIQLASEDALYNAIDAASAANLRGSVL